MTVEQIYSLVNLATTEVLGTSNVVQEDLSNLVDVGTEIFNASAVDNYVKSLVNHIGKVIFVNRPYTGRAPKVLMDSWEFGSVLEKIQMDLPVAEECEDWELTDKQSYDPNIFYKPTVSAKFFNSKVTFEIPVSITERQVKESFSNAEQLNGFISMIYNAVDKSMSIKLDGLVMRTINNMIGETIYDEYNSGKYGNASGIRAINLLYKYNAETGQTLKVKDALKDSSFLKYASKEIGLTIDRMGSISTLFNIGGKDRFTPKDLLHVIFLSDFVKATDSYLMSDTFHNELVALPNSETVAYWQGSGEDYSFGSVSKIDVKTNGNHEVSLSGILGIAFDRDALGVTNMNRRTTTNYNPKAEFYNNWFKMDAGYFNDLNENCVVFFIADPAA